MEKETKTVGFFKSECFLRSFSSSLVSQNVFFYLTQLQGIFSCVNVIFVQSRRSVPKEQL